MQRAEIQTKIRDIITNVTDIPAEEIGETTSFTKDLDLDSLALLEIGVDVDYAFQLGLPDERLKELDCLQDTVNLVVAELAGREAEPVVA